LLAAAAEGAGGVAVDEQGQEHAGRVLVAAGAATVDLELAQVQGVDGVEDEMNQIMGGHPLAQIGWEQQRGVAVDGNEACRPTFEIRPAVLLFKRRDKNIALPRSDRLPADCHAWPAPRLVVAAFVVVRLACCERSRLWFGAPCAFKLTHPRVRLTDDVGHDVA
jgi:hypothetical protein